MTDASNIFPPPITPQIQHKSLPSLPVARDVPGEKKVPLVPKAGPHPGPKVPLVDFENIREQLAEAIAALNDQMERNGRGLKFSIDDTINRHIIVVSNTQTGEVVRQIPTEVAVRVAHSIEEVKGLLSDEAV
jgi:hypothetical protein